MKRYQKVVKVCLYFLKTYAFTRIFREIVKFQKDIGVDVGTMLDIFGRPDMSRKELEYAVEETANRAIESLDVAGNNMLLNGPIQGGLHEDLRALSGSLMSSIGKKIICTSPKIVRPDQSQVY